jgi:DNA polymerase-3 subunit gamma/tau
MLSAAAFNALLKTLEEPPAHTLFVLATTEEHKVIATIRSRCQQFNFRLLTTPEIVARLNWLAQQEALDIEPAAVDLMARQASGSMRDGESLLDQLFVAPGERVTLERAQQVLGTAPDAAVAAVADAWLDGDTARGLAVIHESLNTGADARQFSRQMVAHLRQLLLLQAGGTVWAHSVGAESPSAERRAEMQAQAGRASRRGLIDAVRRFHEASLQPAGSWQPQLPLELAFIEIAGGAEEKGSRGEGERGRKGAGEPVGQAVPLAAEQGSRGATELTPAESAAHQQPATTPPDTVEERSVSPAPLTLPAIAAMWPEMTKQVGRRMKNLPALMTMCKPLALEAGTIVLGFDYPLLKDKFDKTPGALDLVIDTFRALGASDYTVRTVTTSDYPVPIAREEFQALAAELGGVVREE